MSEKRLVAIETKLETLAVGHEALARDLRSEMKGMGDRLGHQMRALHEDTIANIKVLAPDFEPIRREYREADAKLKEDILQQLARARRE